MLMPEEVLASFIVFIYLASQALLINDVTK